MLAVLLSLLSLPPSVLPPDAADPTPRVVEVDVEKIPGVVVGPVKVVPAPAPVAPVEVKPAPFVPPLPPPRWVAPPAPNRVSQPARRMYYHPPMRSCVGGRCYVTPGYWDYR